MAGLIRVYAHLWRNRVRLLEGALGMMEGANTKLHDRVIRYAGVSLVGGMVGIALCAQMGWTPYDPTEMRILERLSPPSTNFWLGTDAFGRDIFSMVMMGARNSLTIALCAIFIGFVGGVSLGMVAALYAHTWLDQALRRGFDLIFAFPAFLSAFLILNLWGAGAFNTILAIGLFNLPVFARLARAASLKVLEHDFIRAARLAGAGSGRVLFRHVWPNIAGIMVVQASLQLGFAILAEAGLSYLGLGLQPPQASWGRMLFDAQTYLSSAPFLAFFPGAAIALSVFGFNLLGDTWRAGLEPKEHEKMQKR